MGCIWLNVTLFVEDIWIMDKRFTQESGIGIFTGNEMIVKGGLEGRVGLITGYPGSPVAEVWDAAGRIRELLEDRGIVVQIANNEALGAARLNGAQMERIRAMAVMKSVGAHVASDGLAIGNMAGTGPGGAALAVFGDDTWSEGTQVPADSRFISKHLYMPVVEPSTFQEVKDWIEVAFDLSEKTRLYVAYLVTSNQADGGGTVEVRPNQYPEVTFKNPQTLDSRTIPVDDRVVIPPHTAVKEDEVLRERLPSFLVNARVYGLNRILYPPDSGVKRIGFATSSLAYSYLEHALELLGVQGKIPILKFGITYPIDREILRAFSAQVDRIFVVEEKRPFLEEQVKAALQEMRQSGEVGPFEVWGKRFPDGCQGFPESKGMNPSIVLQTLAPLISELDDPTVPVDRERISREVALIEATERYDLRATTRTPSFCPGCPHRDSASVLKRVVTDLMDESYTRKHHGHEAMDVIFHGDIGCYSLLKYEPFDRLMHNLSGMGLGGGTGAGIDPFITNKQVVFMGDSTFFHTGMGAISDSIKNRQDITYVILDNKTTAMTGHQPTPGVGLDIMGKATFSQDIERVVRGMAGGKSQEGAFVARMNPADRQGYRKVVEDAILKDGVKVIIADKECGITYHRRVGAERRRVAAEKGFLPEERHINITPEVCEYCLECTRATGCSGLTVEETLYGPKISTDLSLCVADGACTKVTVANGDKTCPSFEEVIVRRTRPPEVRTEEIALRDIPEPEIRSFDGTWYAYVGGVGGMGVNTVSAIIATAGAKQGYSVQFTNKKGLAIRNGSVYSHVSFTRGDRVISQITPYGHADLLLGLDILEAVRGIEPTGHGRIASPEHTAAVVETGKRPTILTLTGKDDFDPAHLETLIKRHTDSDRYFGMDLGKISERFLGDKIYANSMLLGAAYQRGALPLELENIRWAIERNVKKDLERNLKAFDMGRMAAEKPHAFEIQEAAPGFQDVVEDKLSLLERSGGSRKAGAFQAFVAQVHGMELEESVKIEFALGVYDLIRWKGPDYARSYADRVWKVYDLDTPEFDYGVTGAVIRYLARVMAYKDEIYVAQLLTSEEKRRRDHKRYNIDPEGGDKIAYVHLTRPHFKILGIDVVFDLNSRDWMLRILRRLKILRSLLPSWHQEEKEYRDWYIGLVDGFSYEGEKQYRMYLRVLGLPEGVRGYREVIWGKMKSAMRMGASLLNGEAPRGDEEYLMIEPAEEKVQRA